MNKFMHTNLGEGDTGRYAIVPGSPERTARIAAFLENPEKIAQNREHTTWCGFLEGELVTVTSTGMGGPSTAICMEELVQCGVDTFIRIGTAASTSHKVALGDIVIPNGTVRMEGTGLHYLPMEFPAVPDALLVEMLVQAANQLGYPSAVGISITKDSYYTEINPETKPIGYELVKKWTAYEKGGAVATSMEEATLFLVAASLGVRAASVLVSATNYKDETSSDTSSSAYPADTEVRAIKTGVEGLRRLILQERKNS